MGHAVERIARERGHEIVAVIDADNALDLEGEAFATADVAIEFTTPATAPDNVWRAVRRGVAVVSGSTGWEARRPEVEARVAKAGGTMMWASNFSIGVYITRRINAILARMMRALPQYSPRMAETHHIHKLDHPSGTAVTLAEDIIRENGRLREWTDEGMTYTADSLAPTAPLMAAPLTAAPAGALPVVSLRQGEVPGTHSVEWSSEVDSITLTHRAMGRDGFALGAVMAAEWIKGRTGVFTIDEMMNEIFG